MEFIGSLKEKDNRKALYAALIFMMLLLLFFLLVSMSEPDPPLQEKIVEVEIEFGSPPMGGSNSSESESTVTNTITESAQEEDTQEEESVYVPSGQGTSSSSQNTEEEQPKPDDAFTFSSNNGNGEGTGSGDDFGSGDGVGGNGTGNTPGGGPGTSNPTRKIISRGGITAQLQEDGKIGLELWVDENGKVVRTKFNESRSNSGSAALKSLAEKWAKTMKYEKIPGAPVQYVGTQVFTFKKH